MAAPSSSSLDPLPTIQHLHGGRLRTQQGEEAARAGGIVVPGQRPVGAGTCRGWLAATAAWPHGLAGCQPYSRQTDRREEKRKEERGVAVSDIGDQGCI